MLKLKQNNGFQNLGGFDYEKWLFYQNIHATGYVKKSKFNQLIAPNSAPKIATIRQNLRDLLAPYLQNLAFGGVLNALIIGDRSLMEKSHWALFKATGTTHLSVISGLHIGLVSGFVFFLVAWFWCRCERCCLRIPGRIVGAYFGITTALIYALIAGLSVPTQRAFIMASVVFISIILRRNYGHWQLYGAALLLVLMSNPTSILSVGFWLSFYVVAVIIYGAKHHQNKHWIVRLMYIQLLISVCSLPLIIWFFGSASTLSPMANLVAIPVFSFIATPAALFGSLLALVNLTDFAQLSFDVANQSLLFLAYFLEMLQQIPFNHWQFSFNSGLDFGLIMSALLLILWAKKWQFKALSLPIFAFVIFSSAPNIAKNTALITVFDVGQGLSVLVQTTHHALLFDTGNAFRSGFNLGDSVINPALQLKHITTLDKIIISHGDRDHIGGLPSVLNKFSTVQILSSVPHKIRAPAKLCQSGQSWRWDGVLFEILNPEPKSPLTGNNASCVLKISTPTHAILLTGDIEKNGEKSLLKHHLQKLSSDILLAPHHGSHTSSTQRFIEAVAPNVVIISSGFHNRFQHPDQRVVQRYLANNIQILNTSCTGQIEIKLGSKFGSKFNSKLGSEILLSEYRKTHRHYSMRQCDTL